MRERNYEYAELMAWKIEGQRVVCCRLSGPCDGLCEEYWHFYSLIENLPMNIYIHSLKYVTYITELEPGCFVSCFGGLEEKKCTPYLCEVHDRTKVIFDMLGISDTYILIPTLVDAINLAIPSARFTSEEELTACQIFYKKPFTLQDMETLRQILQKHSNEILS